MPEIKISEFNSTSESGRPKLPLYIAAALVLLISIGAIVYWGQHKSKANTATTLTTAQNDKTNSTTSTQSPTASPTTPNATTPPATTPTNPTTSPTTATKTTTKNTSSTPTSSTPSTPTTPTTPSSPSACSSPSWSSSAAFGSWSTNGYLVNNNVWNTGEAGPQSIYACAWNNWYIIANQPGSGTDDSVKSYADTQKHVNIPLSTMTTIPSTFNVSTPTGGGAVTPNSKQWNAAYDLWLDNFGTEVMVWTNWTANWQYWYGVYNGVNVTIDGVSYAAYYNGSGGMWFIRKNVTNNGSVDLASILRWAVSQGWLQNTQTLNEIEYGFEVLYTGEQTRFDLINYTLTAN